MEGDRGEFDHLALDVVAVVVGLVVRLVLVIVREGYLASRAVVFLVQRLVDLHYIIPTYTNSFIVLSSHLTSHKPLHKSLAR